MISRDDLERLLATLQAIQPAEPPTLIPDSTPLPARTPARIPAQRRGEAR